MALEKTDFTPERRESFGIELDAFLDEINERLSSLSTRIEGIASSGEAQLVNSTGGSLDPGTVLGVVSGGSLSKAVGGSTPTRGVLINKDLVASGDLFTGAFSGLHRVNLEAGAGPTPGVFAFLSSSSSGTVTPTLPAQGRQVIGIFQGTRGDDGKAPVFLAFDVLVRNVP